MTDWQVGDLALCTDDSPSIYGKTCIRRGAIYTVEKVVEDAGAVGVTLADVAHNPATLGYYAKRFRKIRPSAIEHIEALKRLPVKEPEDA